MLSVHLHPLSLPEQMLFLTTLLWNEENAASLWANLDVSIQETFHEKYKQLLKIPSEKRPILVASEIRRLWDVRTSQGIEVVDPSWIAAELKKESPRIIAMILFTFPASLARKTVELLPEDIQKKLPNRQQLEHISVIEMRRVRQLFDQQFASMLWPREGQSFSFYDLALLEPTELVLLLNALGPVEVATAFLPMGKRALAELLGRLKTQEADNVILHSHRLTQEQWMSIGAAEAFFSRLTQDLKEGDQLMLKAGLHRLARAFIDQDPLWVKRLSQRFPRAYGKYILHYWRQEKIRLTSKEGSSHESILLRNEIIELINDLASRGKMREQFALRVLKFEKLS